MICPAGDPFWFCVKVETRRVFGEVHRQLPRRPTRFGAHLLGLQWESAWKTHSLFCFAFGTLTAV